MVLIRTALFQGGSGAQAGGAGVTQPACGSEEGPQSQECRCVGSCHLVMLPFHVAGDPDYIAGGQCTILGQRQRKHVIVISRRLHSSITVRQSPFISLWCPKVPPHSTHSPILVIWSWDQQLEPSVLGPGEAYLLGTQPPSAPALELLDAEVGPIEAVVLEWLHMVPLLFCSSPAVGEGELGSGSPFLAQELLEVCPYSHPTPGSS